jgi:hypothetical protein
VPKLLNEITQYVSQTFHNYIYKTLNVTKIVVYLIYHSKMKWKTYRISNSPSSNFAKFVIPRTTANNCNITFALTSCARARECVCVCVCVREGRVTGWVGVGASEF